MAWKVMEIKSGFQTVCDLEVMTIGIEIKEEEELHSM